MEESSTLKLIVEKGPREGEALEFKPGKVIRIGRLVRGNTLAIKDAGISSKHLSIEPKLGKWLISDLDSSNGTLLNGSKLPPLSAVDLHDGDIVKIGELTSIVVKIFESHGGDSQPHGGRGQPRRNPRRRGTASSKKSDPGDSVAENRSRKGGLRADLVSIGEDSELGIDGEFGNAKEVEAENLTRRGRLRRAAKASKSEPGENFSEVKKTVKVENLGPTEPKQGRKVSTRRLLSSVEEHNTNLDGNGDQELEILDQIVDKRKRGGARRKKKLQEELGEDVGKEDLDDGGNVKVSNLDTGDCEKVAESLMNKQAEAFQVDILENGEAAETSKLEREGCEGLVTTLGNEETGMEAEDGQLGNEETGMEAEDGPDLEKMTLGEWFDYLEVYLPKQIHKETEKMILSMKQKTEQFHEFRLKQRNDKEKGKMPVG